MHGEKFTFHQVQCEQEREQAGTLLHAYLAFLNARLQSDYGFAFDIDRMLESDLNDPYKFGPPLGRFYLVQNGNEVVGVGCLKQLEEGVGEIQRMYVPEDFRGLGIGRSILKRLINDARSIGYRTLRLESLEFLHAAHALYESEGFRRIDPYPNNSMMSYQSDKDLDRYFAITVFMEMTL